MPDSFEHTPSLTMRMPNGALASLAGNLDLHHSVGIADLVLAQGSVRQTVERLIRDLRPEVVGLSIMTFQRTTALRLARMVRAWCPSARVVAGGYDPSLAPDAYVEAESGIDFIVRGEGETTFRDLVCALDTDASVARIPGLSWRGPGGGFVHNPDRAVSKLRGGEIRLPNRGARLLSGYTFLGRQIDVVEASFLI